MELKEFIDQYYQPRNALVIKSIEEYYSFISLRKLETGELESYISESTDSEIQPLITFIKAAWLAKAEKISPETDTTPESEERFTWVLQELGIENFRDLLRPKLPNSTTEAIIGGEFLDWYTEERAAENTNYWDDYRRVLARNGWDANAISSVDLQATEVIRRLEDPTREPYRSSRGLVVGHVQSGKTANFTAVAAKAIDAGYRVIIVLAGMMDNLREQTQRRLDKELCGREAVLAGADEDNLTSSQLKSEKYFQDDEEWDRDWDDVGGAFVQHGAGYGELGFPQIKRVTTSVIDYRRSGVNVINIEHPNKKKPIYDPENLANMGCLVAVVKKNKKVLQHFNSDLSRAAKLTPGFSSLPVLIIDDESDQASLNTKNAKKQSKEDEAKRTAVNEQIVQLLKNCPRAQYVGYTATPFANVFVNPNDPDDLYPRDFVLMLKEPPSYRGARWFHDLNDPDEPFDRNDIETFQRAAFVRPLLDQSANSEEFFQETRITELTTALDMFVLTGAVKKYREAHHDNLSFRHHTMLVHEAVGNSKHTESKETLDKIWKNRSYLTGRHNRELRKLYEKDLEPVMRLEKYNPDFSVPKSFKELEPFINEAYVEMMRGVDSGSSPVLQVDSLGNDVPDFESNKVWKVLVGGAKLSRGYTVEGLTISYFRRKAGSADTLMQTGRWFGFRKGYQDLVRLYAPDDLIEMFEAAMVDEIFFRENIAAYAELDDENRPVVTPAILPALVQQSLKNLKPTSSNKMFNAYIVKQAAAPTPADLSAIPARGNKRELVWNFEKVAIPLLKALNSAPITLHYERRLISSNGNRGVVPGKKKYLIGTIHALEFISILKKMRWNSETDYESRQVKPVIKYLEELCANNLNGSKESGLAEVAIILPVKNRREAQYNERDLISIEDIEFDIPLVIRKRREKRADINASSEGDRLVLQKIASGQPLIKPADNGDVLSAESATEPFDLSPDHCKTRASVLLTLFDDRDRDEIEKTIRDGKYVPPEWEKGEVGVALAVNSPHSALQDNEGLIKWSVHAKDEDGNAPITTQAG